MKVLSSLLALHCALACPAQETAAVSVAPALNTHEGVWHQWRGPDRSGCVGGPAWPKRVTPGNFERKWRVELGPSYSGPVVDRDRVYTTETVDREFEVVRAFQRSTGAEVWQARWKGSMEVPFFAARNGSWIRSTPAVDDGSLYVAGMLDVLVCLDAATGEERWRVDLAARFNVSAESFGFVCSPLVAGDAVYVQASAGLVKLDKQTGVTIWRSLPDTGGMMGGAFSSPVLADIGGVAQLLVQSRDQLCGVELDQGEVLWRKRVRTFRGMNILTPQPYGDGVFTSSYGGRSHFFDIANEDGSFSAEEAWNNRQQGYMTSPVVIDGHAYFYLRNKRFTCVDLETGETAWTSGLLGDEYWSLVAQGDRILALTNSGELMHIAANPERYEVIDTLEIAESETWAHLAVDGGQVFVRELDGLAAYDWK